MKVIRKNVDIEVEGVHARYDVTKSENGKGYVYEITLGSGWSRMIGARGYFERPATGTIAQAAHQRVAAAVRLLIAQSYREFVYVVIKDMPGFAEEMLGEHTQGGYHGTAEGGPLYVVRCDNHEQAEAMVARVREIGTIVDGERSFAPKVTDVTNHALDALDGDAWHATNALTFLAADRAENAVVHAIGG